MHPMIYAVLFIAWSCGVYFLGYMMGYMEGGDANH